MIEERGLELRGGIRPLLFPQSLAVVGASDRTAESAADLQQVLDGGVPTWFVNPNRPSVLGRECFASLAALPEQPECAYLLVCRRELLPEGRKDR